jgi:Uma2 family endonuclease
MTSFFEAFASGSGPEKVEWVDGVVITLPALSTAQQQVVSRLFEQLSEHVEANQSGIILPAPFPVRMPEEMRVARQPDLVFVPGVFIEAIQEHFVNSHGVTLAVEVCDVHSLDSALGRKRDDYEMAGIPEYWVLDVSRSVATVFELINTGYVEQQPDAKGCFDSAGLPGFQLHPDKLWPR